jgi:hypothetical protein
MRDMEDYLITARGGTAPTRWSPFNIKADSVLLSNFERTDIAQLFAQRTEEMGQEISEEALNYVYGQSRGQPRIVNSLFMRATMRILDEESRETVTIKHIMQAEEQMILARETHLDSLAVRMEDPRVCGVMEALISGEPDPTLSAGEGFRLCMDLGLVSKEGGTPQVANPIYREVLARYMTGPVQDALPDPEWEWQKADGSLDMDALLKEFQQFWQENSEIWEERSDYTEAFPHLLLMAFLQRVLNGGGRIEREYAAGRGRMDLYVEYRGGRYIIEVKLVRERRSPEQVRARGLEQIGRYRNSKAPDAPAYLVIFDRRLKAKELSWEERLSWTKEGTVTVIGC